MKDCPKCKATVETIDSCPVCNYSLINLPDSFRKTEKYKINAFFIKYLFLKHTFALFCTIFTVVFSIFTIKNINFLWLLSLIMLIYMWVESLFKSVLLRFFENFYSEDFLLATHKISIYVSGIAAIFCILLKL